MQDFFWNATATQSILLAQQSETPWYVPFGMGVLFIVIGIILIFTGIQNVNSQEAEETGARRLVMQATGNEPMHRGGMAVLIGWSRIVGGVVLIIAGIAFGIVRGLFYT